MKVLITGITGFVGSHLADYILQNHPGVEVFGLKRWRSPMDNIRHIERHLKLYDGDLCDLSSLLPILEETKPDLIFHFAAQSFVPYSYSVPIETLNTNVIGTANLLEAARIKEAEGGWDCRIMICSSPEVYGQADNSTPITEGFPLKPLSPYAVSKVAEDMLAYMYYEAYGLKTIRSRAFAHEGPRRGDVFAVSSFAKQIAMIEKGKQKPVIKVGNLDSSRTYCDVRDMVRAYWLLLEKGQLGDVYNIAGDEMMTLREVLDRLLKLSSIHLPEKNTRIEVDRRLLRPIDVNQQIADDRKFRELTKWQPEISFQRTLEDTLDYWRENE